jgi:Uma2 family endonuclease
VSTIARLSLAEYDRMIEHGVFDEHKRRRLEFIRGEIREMTPMGPEHEELVTLLDDWSHDNLSSKQARVRVQSSIGLPQLESAPEPDLAWVTSRSYRTGRPTAADVLLVIEVAESSLEYDRGEKAQLYAGAGISDHWIVNVREQTIEVHRDPQAGRYRSIETHSGQSEIRPLAVPTLAFRPSTLWRDD